MMKSALSPIFAFMNSSAELTRARGESQFGSPKTPSGRYGEDVKCEVRRPEVDCQQTETEKEISQIQSKLTNISRRAFSLSRTFRRHSGFSSTFRYKPVSDK